jgi:sporulation protein YlmC with PRC-barrel domain
MEMDLGKHVLDKEILDRDGLRAGKVDDLLLEIGEPRADGTLPEPQVVALVSGPMALSNDMPRPWRWVARQIYRLLGVRNPQPMETAWDRVTAIDVVVHLDVARESGGMMELANAVNRRYIGKLPGA